MRLEEAIKQESFKSEYHKLLVNVIYTYFSVKEHSSTALNDYDITMQQYNVLRILKGQYPKGITTSDIRSRMLDKMSDASRLVDRLEKLNLVSKRVNPDDRRLVIVKLTEAGLNLVEKIAFDKDTEANYASRLSVEEAIQLNALLDKLRG